jgi:hypothetical protein
MADQNHHHVKHIIAALESAVSAHGDMSNSITGHLNKHMSDLETARKKAENQARIDEGIARQNG